MSTQRPPPTSSSSAASPSTRHGVGVRALVAGLAPVVLPLVIRYIERSTMMLAYDNNAAAIDERWATVGAGVMVIFKIGPTTERERVTVHGHLTQRFADGIEVKLIALDDAAIAALRSLISEAQGGRSGGQASTSRSAAKTVAPSRTTALIACEAAAKQHIVAPLSALLDGLAVQLQALRSGARTPAEHKRYDSWSTIFNGARAPLLQNLTGVVAENFSAFLRQPASAHEDGGHDLLAGGLSLMESTDLRASLVVAEVINRIASGVQPSWHDLSSQLAQLAAQKVDDCILSPSLLCHQLRDLLDNDANFSNWHQFDLSAGFTERFAQRLDELYGALSAVLSSHGIQAQQPSTRGSHHPH